MIEKKKAGVVNKFRLDAMGCSAPNCTHEHDDKLVLVPRCHPGPVETYYDKTLAQIVVRCFECNREVVRIQL